MDVQRRNFIRGKFLTTAEEVRLPWIKSADLFYNHCTRCDECVKACPEGIIQKADGGYPSIDFKLGECTFCEKCALACPEDIFDVKKQRPWLFIAVLEQSCLSLNHISCRSCQDSCQYGALKFPLVLGKIPFPHINAALCTGCGACVSPCPSFALKIVSNSNQNQPEGCENARYE